MATQQPNICPECGYEYQPWVEVCPDCGAALQTVEPRLRIIKGELDPAKDPRWTVVTNVPNAIIGNFLKSQLEDAGIPTLMRRSGSVDIAEFSHNDFVPQELLVPFHRLREARSLVDSPPGDPYDFYTPYDEGSLFDDEYPEPPEVERGSELPGGWSMLPTEADIDARQHVRRSRTRPSDGWQWSQDRPLYDQTGGYGAYDDPGAYETEPDEYDEPEDFYGTPSSTGGYGGQARWIRVTYAVLFLTLSLPFIISILQQMWNLMTHFP